MSAPAAFSSRPDLYLFAEDSQPLVVFVMIFQVYLNMILGSARGAVGSVAMPRFVNGVVRRDDKKQTSTSTTALI